MMRFLREHAESAGYSSPFRGMGILCVRALAPLRLGSRFRSKFGQCRLADDGAPLHAAVVLGRRERVLARELGESDAAVEARCLGASDPERVEPDPRADPT